MFTLPKEKRDVECLEANNRMDVPGRAGLLKSLQAFGLELHSQS